MHIKQLKDSWKVIRDELDNLPMDVFISDKPRPTGEWQGSPIVQKIVNDYSNGKFGWLKGGQEHVQEEWISWPLIWNGKMVCGNSAKCPKTVNLLSRIDGIEVAGFSLMKGGVRLTEHLDVVGEDYKYTYHLGLKCPMGSILHHSVQGDIVEENGKHILMDARQRHWAENQSNEDRIILYMERYKT
jgi:aspartyl/asparaginyl beta-hydroxylase (cupin superfamily)